MKVIIVNEGKNLLPSVFHRVPIQLPNNSILIITTKAVHFFWENHMYLADDK